MKATELSDGMKQQKLNNRLTKQFEQTNYANEWPRKRSEPRKKLDNAKLALEGDRDDADDDELNDDSGMNGDG